MTDLGITTASWATHAFVNIDHHWKTNGPVCQEELAEIREQRLVLAIVKLFNLT